METFGFDQLEEKLQDILKKSPAIRTGSWRRRQNFFWAVSRTTPL